MTQERKPASDTSTFETLHLGLTVDLIEVVPVFWTGR